MPRLQGRVLETTFQRRPHLQRPQMVLVTNLLAGVDVNENGHWSLLSLRRLKCGSFRRLVDGVAGLLQPRRVRAGAQDRSHRLSL